MELNMGRNDTTIHLQFTIPTGFDTYTNTTVPYMIPTHAMFGWIPSLCVILYFIAIGIERLACDNHQYPIPKILYCETLICTIVNLSACLIGHTATSAA